MNFYTLHIKNADQLRQEKTKRNQQTKDLLIRIKKVLDTIFDNQVNEIVQKSIDATLSELRDSLNTDMVQVPLAAKDDQAWISNLNYIDIPDYLNQKVHYGLNSDGNFYINYEIPRSCDNYNDLMITADSYNDLMSTAIDATENKDLHNFYIALASLKNGINHNDYKFENMQIAQVTNDQDTIKNKIVVNYHRDLSALIIDILKRHGYSATRACVSSNEAIIVTLKSDADH